MISCCHLRVWFVPVAVGLLAVVPARNTLAQQAAKPTVVVSLASWDKLLSDIEYISRAAGAAEVGGLVTLMAAQYTEGINTNKPAGMYLTFAGPQPTGVAFVPVSDFGAVVAKIEEAIGEPEDVGGGVMKIALQREIFFKEKGGWAFISDSAANLDSTPANPGESLGTLPEDYELAIQVNMQEIPPPLREMAISAMRDGFERGIEGAIDGDDADLQAELGERSIDSMVSFIQEADQITAGWGVDSDKGTTFLDVTVTAVEGSELSSQFALLDGNTTKFAGFMLPEAAARLNFTSKASEKEIKQVALMLEVMRNKAFEAIDGDDDLPDDKARATAKEILGSLIEVLDKTVATGKFDGGGCLVLDNGNLQLVAGGFVSDGNKVEKSLKQLVELGRSIENNPKFDLIKFNVATHRGISLHTVDIPLPEGEDEARKVFGDAMSVVVGTSSEAVFVGLGNGCQELLKRVIDESAARGETVTSQATFDIALGPVLEFAAAIEESPEVQMMADALSQVDGDDRISFTVTSVPRGAAYRFQVQAGVLQLIGQAVKMQGQR